MECEYKLNGVELRIVLPREVDHHVANQIQEEADLLIDTYHIRRIIFDFRITEFMDSSGIGVILGRYRNMTFSGGVIQAENVSERVGRILKMSGLDHVLMGGAE